MKKIKVLKFQNKIKIIPNEGGDGMTQSPREKSFTAEPTACISPTPSYPPIAGTGGLTGYTPTTKNLQTKRNQANSITFHLSGYNVPIS